MPNTGAPTPLTSRENLVTSGPERSETSKATRKNCTIAAALQLAKLTRGGQRIPSALVGSDLLEHFTIENLNRASIDRKDPSAV